MHSGVELVSVAKESGVPKPHLVAGGLDVGDEDNPKYKRRKLRPNMGRGWMNRSCYVGRVLGSSDILRHILHRSADRGS